MAIPRAIQQQNERAEAELARLRGNPEGENLPAENDPPAHEAEPESTDHAETEPPATDPAADKGADYWQNRFNTLQGKYNAEVPRLNAEVRAEREGRQSLEQRLAQMEQRFQEIAEDRERSATQQQQAASSQRFQKLFAENLMLDESGQQLLQEWVDSQVAARLADMEARFGQRLEGVNAQTQQLSEAQFWASMGDASKQYHALRQQPGFGQWLDGLIPMGAGRTYRQALMDAYQARDPGTFADVVNAYVSQQENSQGSGGAQPAPSFTSNPALQGRAQPRQAASGGNHAPPAPPRYTGEDYARDNTRVAQLLRRGKHDEAAKLEAEANKRWRQAQTG